MVTVKAFYEPKWEEIEENFKEVRYESNISFTKLTTEHLQLEGVFGPGTNFPSIKNYVESIGQTVKGAVKAEKDLSKKVTTELKASKDNLLTLQKYLSEQTKEINLSTEISNKDVEKKFEG